MPHTLGLLGGGMIAASIARLAVDAGLDVVVSNTRGPATLADLVAGLGGRTRAATPEEAALAGDLVVAAVPPSAHGRLPAVALAGKTVLDTANYYPERDGRVPELEEGTTSSARLQSILPGARVVKAFNNITPHQIRTLARAAGAADRSALPVAADDETARAEAVALLDLLGFDAVDAGTLRDSWRCEPGTPVYIRPYLGGVPAMNIEDFLRWTEETPGVVVPAERVTALLAEAVRLRAGEAELPKENAV
ncbi:NADPH-dependent F420 reductase [Phytomonospora endophytica]|uniref:Pyrroline-5-carboxylate reductase catalytic N-terminal domain-containing protein n=1 Tax=Phytomonospora endophytica TaxID=714109 RepID=A0A841FZX5_9ACTN|nr:NAD(P)-binding domain-containing protein [Phytomonospora endophytica]MBB6037989.1 hypothetical protein [Phytomonospora endophytica]GIG68888.1 NADP oxidoreductase [Phytomonospora endophytica]